MNSSTDDCDYGYSLKGIVSLDGFGFWGLAWSVLGLPRRRCFTIFRCSNDFYNAKSIFLPVNASLGWLNKISGEYLIQVSLLLTGQQGLVDFFRYRPLHPIGWRIVQILHQRRRKTSNTAPTNPSAIQASSQSTFINEKLYSTWDLQEIQK